MISIGEGVDEILALVIWHVEAIRRKTSERQSRRSDAAGPDRNADVGGGEVMSDLQPNHGPVYARRSKQQVPAVAGRATLDEHVRVVNSVEVVIGDEVQRFGAIAGAVPV